MNWEVLGAIGEVAGAVAVVVTLLYLARQTQINARSVQASSSRELTVAESELHLALASNPEVKRIFLKSMQVPMEPYSDLEWVEFRGFAMSTLLHFESLVIDRSLDVAHEE